MKKSWFQIIDFYRLTGITLLWLSAWLFMMPWQTDITAPFYNNIWGSLFALFGATADKTVEAQQTPDLMSGIVALLIILVLQLRGILDLTVPQPISESDRKAHKALLVTLNLISLIVHTLFFTMLVKIFIFPENGSSALLQRMKADIGITVFTAVCVTGMLLGAASVSKLLLILLSLAAIIHNVNFVSSTMGVWGFIAVLLAAAGFYLEFCFDGFSKANLMLDANFIAGRYENLALKAKDEAAEYKQTVKKAAKTITKIL